jgi:hypothetical protein
MNNMKKIIAQHFIPASPQDGGQVLTLAEIKGLLNQIIPTNYLFEEDIHLALEELGFKSFVSQEQITKLGYGIKINTQ